MAYSAKMGDNFIDLLSDYLFACISIVGMVVGIDSIPANQTIIQIVTSDTASSGIDVTQKIMTIGSLFISTIAGLIPIIKSIKSYRRNK